eukprot:Sspe_Gene.54311::Locus_29980_Transcript_1_1_Confidence_1.000_Length_747::g.54311::m.54311
MLTIGSRVPNVVLKTLSKDGIRDVALEKLLEGRKVVLTSALGAFTPTCQNHLPNYIGNHDNFKHKGVDEIVCVAVNDAFVLHAWGNSLGNTPRDGGAPPVTLLSDGNAEFAKATGLLMNAVGPGFGQRIKRFSALVEDGVIKLLNVDPSIRQKDTSAEHLLEQLSEYEQAKQQCTAQPYVAQARHA